MRTSVRADACSCVRITIPVRLGRRSLTIPRLGFGLRRQIVNGEFDVVTFFEAGLGLGFHEPVLAFSFSFHIGFVCFRWWGIGCL